MHYLADYGLFVARVLTIVIAILFVTVSVTAIIGKGRSRSKEQLEIKNINEKFADMAQTLNQEILPKDELKKHLKANKKAEKERKNAPPRKRIFVLRFEGDIKASATTNLREEITATMKVAKVEDEIVVNLESAGGMVHAYGLAASQLQRIKDAGISLTVCIDKVAASGGYLMACVADKILAAPFAIVGSIGVVAQIPNFNRLLKKHDIDYEQITAGNYKRTLTIFGENTAIGRKKFQEDVEDIHELFKNYILQHRPNIHIQEVSTGEHWLATRAIDLNLVDKLITSDDYLLSASKDADIYEVTYSTKKSLAEKLSMGTQSTINKLLLSWYEGLEQLRFLK